MLQLAKAKSHLIFSDIDLNTERVVYLNIYQNLLMIAIKMHEYLRNWGVGGKRNISFLRGVIERTINYNYITFRRQTQKKKAPTSEEGSVIMRFIIS
ncbi:hypothetical protein HYPSUDRAFT_36483 [Hypholoma sublateritium FD-334 SS-4]|uniref:Telomerase reverse transcriptase n=1 Tax=Hypholoma sublateritium (strain FD-334 SS-4) TaxID=945553 RepID=A0A0D2LF81_HYPSF|nr:hypothetical protein HYPSUDRAFT_36483 [Hypholoma sublateritium FD-334 SS-4]